MIFDPKVFYQTYQKDYHKFKAIYLKSMLEKLDEVEESLFGEKLDEEDREALKKVLKSDLRQTYFHAVETFFELLFALNPKDQAKPDDNSVLFRLTYSEGRETKKKN